MLTSTGRVNMGAPDRLAASATASRYRRPSRDMRTRGPTWR